MERRVHSAKHIEKVCKKSAGKTKRPCVTPSRCSTGALVVSFVQLLDDFFFSGGQVPDFGGQLIAGKGPLGGCLAGGGCVGDQKRAAESLFALGPHGVQTSDKHRLSTGQRVGHAVLGQGKRPLGGEQVGRVLVDRPLDGAPLALGGLDGLAEVGGDLHRGVPVGVFR